MKTPAGFIDDFKTIENKEELHAFVERHGLLWQPPTNTLHVIAQGSVDGADVQVRLTAHDQGGAAPELSDMAALIIDGTLVQEIMFSPPGWQEA
jgi:hypothetical protein